MRESSQPQELQLSNGIPVILQHYDAPVAATYWWVRTGSTSEGPGEEGFAHFLEHMLFKDASAKESGRASTGQMARAIESMGGDINAYTSFDQTVYHVTCAAHHWERVLDVFGTMAKPQKFLKQDFEREREVILEELRRSNDSPERQLFQGLFSVTFGKHPYGRPVIGFERTLKQAKLQALEKFYRAQYSSRKMGLVLVGPVGEPGGKRAKAILRLLEKRFGKSAIPEKKMTQTSGTSKARTLSRKSHQDRIGFVQKPFQVKTPTLSLSFRAPDLQHPDVPALDLLSSVLGMGELSRLYQRLFYQDSIATDVSASLYVPRDPGMLYIHAEMEGMEKIEPTFKAILEELVRIRDEGPTEEELNRVLVNAESERIYAMQTADGLASRLGFLKFVLGDLGFDDVYLNQLRKVTKQEIQRVAREYLDPRRMSLALLSPKEAGKFDSKPLEALAEKILAKTELPQAAVVSKKGIPLEPQRPVVIKLSSGLRLVVNENPASPVFSVYAAVLGGSRLELGNPLENREKDWGSSYLMGLTWTKGTRGPGASKDSRQIASIVEGHAASMDGFSGRNTSGLQLTGLVKNWKALSSLFSEVLAQPSFPEDEVSHSRRVVEESIRGIEDHSSQLCSRLFFQTLYESHPYGLLSQGSLESLPNIRSEKLLALHRSWIRPDRLVLSVSGGVPVEEIESWAKDLSDLLGQAESDSNPISKLPIAAESALKAPRWVERSLGREQMHLLVGGLGATFHSADRDALRLMQTLLGGQSGRLFIELREKKSLAYSVAPISGEGIEPGHIGVYIGCAPSKRKEAVEGITKVLEQLANKGPSASEMKRAREFYLGRRAMELQSDPSLAVHQGMDVLYGIAHSTDEELVQRFRKVTAREIQEVCRKYLVEPHLVTSVVG